MLLSPNPGSGNCSTRTVMSGTRTPFFSGCRPGKIPNFFGRIHRYPLPDGCSVRLVWTGVLLSYDIPLFPAQAPGGPGNLRCISRPPIHEREIAGNIRGLRRSLRQVHFRYISVGYWCKNQGKDKSNNQGCQQVTDSPEYPFSQLPEGYFVRTPVCLILRYMVFL